jgi:hypothetical protein
MTIIIILWIVLSMLFASFGRSRKIGFGRSFLICIILSPLVGLIVVLLSEKHSDSLLKLKFAYDSGCLTKEEYNKEVRKIVPNSEDKQNMLIGYSIVFAVGLIIYLIAKVFG